MSLLYLVTESDRDALFYEKCAARLTGRIFSWAKPMRNRKGDGSSAVQTQIKYALRQARGAAAGAEEVCFIAAIDNDRTPHLENAATLQRARLSHSEQTRPARLPWMHAVVHEVLGHDSAAWPLRVAIAVPVEMVESWIVEALGAELPGGPAPHFSRQDQQRARNYYAPADAPPQWKDLERSARAACERETDEDFYEHAATVIAQDAEALAARAESFRLFREQLAAWGRPLGVAG